MTRTILIGVGFMLGLPSLAVATQPGTDPLAYDGFALASGWLDRLLKVGDRGKLMLPEVVGVSRALFLMIFIPLLMLVLFAIDRFAAR